MQYMSLAAGRARAAQRVPLPIRATLVARASWIAGGLLAAVHVGAAVSGLGRDVLAGAGHWLPFAVFALLAVGSVARAVSHRPERAAWFVLSAGTGLHALGHASSGLASPQGSTIAAAAPVLWLSLYPALLVASVLLVRAHWGDGRAVAARPRSATDPAAGAVVSRAQRRWTREADVAVPGGARRGRAHRLRAPHRTASPARS